MVDRPVSIVVLFFGEMKACVHTAGGKLRCWSGGFVDKRTRRDTELGIFFDVSVTDASSQHTGRYFRGVIGNF